MKAMQLYKRLVFSALLATPALTQSLMPAQADDLAARGQTLSQTHCTRCHVVGDFNPHGGISSTPSFQMIVNALPDWQDRFSTFYVRRPHPAAVEFEDGPALTQSLAAMVRVVIRLDDVEAITAFAKTLKKK